MKAKIFFVLFMAIFMFSTVAYAAGTLVPGNPLRVTGTVTDGDNFEVVASNAVITFIKWSAPTTATHVLEIWDKSGRVITILTCPSTVSDLIQYFPEGLRVNGLYVDQMDSGSIEVGVK